MEGLGAKHIAIMRYAKNSTYSNRWQLIFRHEYISLIWLRERGYNLSNYTVSKEKYIPKRVALMVFASVAVGRRLMLVQLAAIVITLPESP